MLPDYDEKVSSKVSNLRGVSSRIVRAPAKILIAVYLQ
jgi:hypothetical protein